MKWDNKGHIFDKAGETIKNYDGSYYIYGAGKLGGITYEQLKDLADIKGFIDIDENKKIYHGIPVHSVDEISSLNGKIIVAIVKHADEVKKMLVEKGLEEDVDFFGNGFIQAYNYFKRNILTLNRVDLSVTNKCTLKCKYCNMFMPHFDKPKDMISEDMISSVDNLFSKVDYIYSFNLLGGEPFINKDFTRILEHTCKYRDKIGRLTIFSNCTILPTQAQIDIIKNNNIIIQLTDYTSAVDYTERLNKFKEIVTENKIENEYFSLDTWSDFGFPHNPSNVTNEKALIKKFDDCCPVFRGLVRNKLYFCHLSLSAEKANMFNGEESDYFLLDDNFNEKELLEFDLGYNDIGYVSFCKICRGCNSNISVDSRIQL